MRALTLYRPWDYAIARLGKRLENRDWKPPASIIGQRIAIHSGKTLDEDAVEDLEAELATEIPELPDSVITCTVVVKGWINSLRDGHPQRRWWGGGIAWVLDDVLILPQPVPCRGNRKLWPLPADVEAKVIEQLRHAGAAPVKTTWLCGGPLEDPDEEDDDPLADDTWFTGETHADED